MGGSKTLSPSSSEGFPEESQLSGESKKGRRRDLIWDTLVELFGLGPTTKQEQRRVGRNVADLKAKGATPDEMRRVYDRCCEQWEGVAFGPEALLKWYDQFRKPKQARSGQREANGPPRRCGARDASANRGEYPEPDKPLPQL